MGERTSRGSIVDYRPVDERGSPVYHHFTVDEDVDYLTRVEYLGVLAYFPRQGMPFHMVFKDWLESVFGPLRQPRHKLGQLGGKPGEYCYGTGTRLVEHVDLHAESAPCLVLIFHQPDVLDFRVVVYLIVPYGHPYVDDSDVVAYPAVVDHRVAYFGVARKHLAYLYVAFELYVADSG